MTTSRAAGGRFYLVTERKRGGKERKTDGTDIAVFWHSCVHVH